jgi:hypothetical protein
MPSYDECREKYLEKIMSEFKQKKLKLRNNKVVTDRKQAIAIAINMAMAECMRDLSQKDLSKIEKKIMMFLLQDHRKISESRVPLTNVIETRILINNYIKLKNKEKAHKLYMLLVERITKAAVKKIKVDSHIWEELYKSQLVLKKN